LIYYTPKMSEFVKSLSRRLFWDVDPETIDDHAHCRYVIQRVLERGTLEDIRATVAHYTMPFMIAEAQQIRSLDPVTLAFAACLGNVKEETFRCRDLRRRGRICRVVKIYKSVKGEKSRRHSFSTTHPRSGER